MGYEDGRKAVIHAFDHAVVVVSDLDAATADYEKLLGRGASWRGAHPDLGTANTLYRLANGYLELLAPTGPGAFADTLRRRLDERGPGPFALAFATDDADACARVLRERGVAASDPIEGAGREDRTGAERHWRNVILPPAQTRAVFVFAIEHHSSPEALPVAEAREGWAGAVEAFDHLVVRSRDPDATRALYGDALGLRLALDKRFEQFGVRLLFFRVGGVTIEIASSLGTQPEPDAADEFWGIAWRVADVGAAHARMSGAGLDLSTIRSGRKPGTRVFSAKAPTHGVPTLVIGPE